MMCVAQHMDEVMPFGEDPRKLASTVKRSMVAVRALEKALKSGYKIAEEIATNLQPNRSISLLDIWHLDVAILFRGNN